MDSYYVYINIDIFLYRTNTPICTSAVGVSKLAPLPFTAEWAAACLRLALASNRKSLGKHSHQCYLCDTRERQETTPSCWEAFPPHPMANSCWQHPRLAWSHRLSKENQPNITRQLRAAGYYQREKPQFWNVYLFCLNK